MPTDSHYNVVSVIIPCFNVEQYVQRALNSVLKQTYPRVEIICVDNRSTDGTAQILADLKTVNKEIKLVSELKQGASCARNAGIKVATGPWIQFLDADDYIAPDKIAYQVETASTSGILDEKGIVVGQKSWIKADGTTVVNKLSEDPWKDLIHGRLGDTCANLWSKSALESIGGWDENRKSSQEIDLQFRLLKAGAMVVYDKKPLTIIYQREEGSISASSASENQKRVIHQRLEIRKYIQQSTEIAHHLPFLDYFIYNNLRLLFFGSRKDFDAMYREVQDGTFDPTADIGIFGRIAALFYRMLGIRNYFKLVGTFKGK